MKTTLLIVLVFFQLIFQIDDEPNRHNCFSKYIGVEMTDDVKQINCFESSELNYQMSFSCNSKTLKKIINKLDLIRDRKGSYEDLKHIFNEYDWWKHENLKSVKQIYKSNTKKQGHISGRWIVLYYDKTNSILYISRFDL